MVEPGRAAVGFEIGQHVLWLGRPAEIIGKTYGDRRVYVVKTKGGTHSDIPERQISAADNVVDISSALDNR